MNTKLLLLFSTSVLAATSAHAQTTEVNPADQATVNEVVVTAQRREERLLDVPISVSVVQPEQAQAAGVVNTRELAVVTPGLVGGQAGYSFQPTIRGISSTGTSPGEESNVALYVDDVYIAAIGATAFNLSNIERIEVSKGPQGTLYGRNATGGAIRIVTSDPSFAPEGKISLSSGLDGPRSQEVSAYGSTGLGDKVAVSLAGYDYDDSGYLENVDPDFKGPKQGSLWTYMLRGKVLYTPIENLKIVGELDFGRTKSGVELTTSFVDDVNGFKNVVGVLPATGAREVSTNEQNFMRSKSYGGYLNVSYDIGAFTLRSLTAMRTADIGVSLDNDRTNLALNRNVYEVDTDTVSQEFTLSSDLDSPLNYIVGLYYFKSTTEVPFFETYAATIGPVVGGVRTVTAPITRRSRQTAALDTEAYAAFGEATYDFNDKISVVAGVRYNTDSKDAWTKNLLAATPEVTSSGSWSNLDYRVTLNYKPSRDVLIYLTNATGFKSGMINALSNPQQQVRPEEVNAFELGYKARWFDRLNVSAAAFHYDYKDIQLTVNNALSAGAGTVGVNILQNAARAKIEGVDFEANGRINKNWSIKAGVSWLPTAEYTEFQGGIAYVANAGGLGATAVATDLSGTRVVRSPELTYNLGLAYETDLGSAGGLYVSGNYYHNSGMFLVTGEATEQPAYNLLSLEAGWTDPTDRYTLGVWARNVTDEAYFVSGLANTGGFSAVWGKPREIGLRLRAAF